MCKKYYKKEGKMTDKTRKAINNVSVVIDMFQSTTEFYKHLESVEVDDLFKMNEIILINLRDTINKVIQTLED